MLDMTCSYLQEPKEDIDEYGGNGECYSSVCVGIANGQVEGGGGVVMWCESIDDLLVVDWNVDIDHTTRDKDGETSNHTKLQARVT